MAIAQASNGNVSIAESRPTLRESAQQGVLTPHGGTRVTLNESGADGRGAPGIFQLSDDYIVESAALDPMLATFWGIPGHDEEMTDYSPQGWAARLDLQRRTIHELSRVPSRGRGDRIAIEVMRERVQAELDLIESGEYHRWLSVMNSHHAYVRDIFDYMPRGSEQDWRRVRARLIEVPPALDKLRASFLYAAGNNQVAARRQALACAAQCSIWGQPDGFFAELAAECPSLDLSGEAALAAAAFTEFGTWLETDYAAIATPHDPVGAERYRLFVRFHNGTDLDLEETYAWGWEELRTIEARMSALVERINPGASRNQCIDELKRDPRYLVEGADNFLAWSQDVIDRTIDELDGQYFDIAAIEELGPVCAAVAVLEPNA